MATVHPRPLLKLLQSLLGDADRPSAKAVSFMDDAAFGAEGVDELGRDAQARCGLRYSHENSPSLFRDVEKGQKKSPLRVWKHAAGVSLKERLSDVCAADVGIFSLPAVSSSSKGAFSCPAFFLEASVLCPLVAPSR